MKPIRLALAAVTAAARALAASAALATDLALIPGVKTTLSSGARPPRCNSSCRPPACSIKTIGVSTSRECRR